MLGDPPPGSIGKVFEETGGRREGAGLNSTGPRRRRQRQAGAYVEPDQPVDPQKDKRTTGGFYAIMPSPVDGSVWGTVGVFGGKVRSCGSIPARTRLQLRSPKSTTVRCWALRHAAATSTAKGVWVSLGSGHLGSFDRANARIR